MQKQCQNSWVSVQQQETEADTKMRGICLNIRERLVPNIAKNKSLITGKELKLPGRA